VQADARDRAGWSGCGPAPPSPSLQPCRQDHCQGGTRPCLLQGGAIPGICRPPKLQHALRLSARSWTSKLALIASVLKAPLPGNNAFFHHSTRVAAYPKRPWLPPAQAAPPDGSYKDPTGPPLQGPSRTATPYRDATPKKGVTPHRDNTPSRGVSPAPAAARGEKLCWHCYALHEDIRLDLFFFSRAMREIYYCLLPGGSIASSTCTAHPARHTSSHCVFRLSLYY